MYSKFLKRGFDFCAAFAAFVILSPILLILTAAGAIVMKGNPFFVQPRPGKNEKIFKLIKFRTMSNAKDASGKLLPDEQRLNRYGKFLRSTSCDELPSLLNILKGDLALVGPRPLLVRYLPLYNERQHHRHDVRPGLTGYAQVHGRNTLSWEERFEMDLFYINHITFWGDVSILWETVKVVLKREGIHSDSSATMEEFTGKKETIHV